VETDVVIEGIAAGSAYATASLDAPALVEGQATELGSEDPGYGYVADSSVVGELISRLPDREREIVRLRFYEELTQGEIAERMGMSQMHVSRLLRRSFEQMRRQLDSL
jgi:RNA polymerase sigma-B factor